MTLLPLITLMLFAFVQAATSTPAPPAAREIAPDTFLVAGAMLPDRGPDGNSIVFAGPSGLIVVDTGRHPWHSDGILNFARDRKQPIAVIVNTHWHLDHSTGNRRLKAAHPQAKVYTTRAVDRALAPGGFIDRNITAVRKQPLDPKMNPTRREETELFIATMETPESLRPDVPVDRSGTMTLAGRALSVRVAADAVTDGDIWIYDEKTGVAVIGDLVTLPAPFFESACPGPWLTALDEVWATPFKMAVPGHGPVMSRDDFDTYRRAFGSFRTCVGSDGPAATCAAGWTKDVAPLLTTDADRKQATDYVTYYVDFLRKGGGASPDCRSK